MISISIIYRIYFLWFEPLAAFVGAIAGFINPTQIIVGTTPTALFPAASAPVTPLSKMLVAQVCSLYLLFAWNQAIVLRVAKDLAVWRVLLMGMVLSDVGHLYALYTADPVAFVDVASWRGTDWINEGTLVLGLALRIVFLAGFGVQSQKIKQT